MNKMTSPEGDFGSAGAPNTLRSAPPRHAAAHALARGLAFFSLAMGLAELVAPRRAARLADMGELPDRPELPSTATVVRAYGLREVGVGTGLLASTDPEPWVWGRVAGDLLDIATVALAPRRRTMFGSSGGSRAGTLVALAAVTALDLYCAEALRRERLARAARPHDWSDRSGFAEGAEAMRGAASDFEVPADMRTPELLRPWGQAGGGGR